MENKEDKENLDSSPANEEEIFSEDNEDTGLFNIQEMGDIPLKISVQLGNTNLKIEEILKLEKGSIIGIDKLAGEPLEFFIGKKLAAKGEVVVINEKYGLRLTDIINPEEKI